MTVTAPLCPLSADVAERLDRIRSHVEGMPDDEVARLVEQAFRNFPGADTTLLVQHLTTPPLVGE